MAPSLSLSQRLIPGADQVQLNALTCGSGRLMLFLHGFPEFSGAWTKQLLHFGRRYQAAAIDLRGYNLSSKPEGLEPYALERVVEDIRCVVQALSPHEPAILVGHDWGGILAWTFARAYPEMLDRLIVINGPHPAIFARELSQNPAQRFASSSTMLFRSPDVAEPILAEFDYALLKRMIFRRTARPDAFSEELRAAYVASWRQPNALRCALNYFRAAQNFHEAFGRSWTIQVPTLVLWGDADPLFLSGNLQGLERYVSNLHVQRHPTATHWVVHEEPQWVQTEIEQFLARSPRAVAPQPMEMLHAGGAPRQ